MGDTGRRSSSEQCPRTGTTGSDRSPPAMPRIALYALVVCVLSVAAAVVSFVQGSWLGIVWVLLAGLTSNMTWYYVKRDRAA
ncbi:hypothetical protein ACWGLF_07535 [Streptomyces puniciscabiei]